MNFEKGLSYLDDFVDRGIDITKLIDELPREEYNRARSRLARWCGGIHPALEAYGLKDVEKWPTPIELERCYYIDKRYKVTRNENVFEEIKASYNVFDEEIEAAAYNIKISLQRDALDEYYRNEFPENTKHTFIEQDDYKHLRWYLDRFYGSSMTKFLNSYGTPSEVFVDRKYGGGNRKAIEAGYVLENLVGEVFAALGDTYEKQRKLNGCVPDYVLEDRWVDVKLQYHTVFWRACETLKKYPQQTKKLEILYALGTGSKTIKAYPNVEFVHISEYYDSLHKAGRSDLVDVIERFIAENTTKQNVS